MLKLQIIYIFLILLLPIIALAQVSIVPLSEISSNELKTLLQKSKPDKNRVDCLLELSKYYLYKPGEEKSDLDSAMLFVNQAKTLSRLLKYSNRLNEIHFLTANILVEQKDISSAITLLSNIQDTAHIKLLLLIGAHYLFKPEEKKSDLDSAMLFARQAEQFSKSLRYKAGIENSVGLVANIFVERRDFPTALSFFPKMNALDKAALLQDMALHYLFRPYDNKSDLDSAFYFLQQARQVGESVTDKELHNQNDRFFGMLYLKKKDLEQGKMYYTKVINYYKKTKHKEIEAYMWGEFGGKIHREPSTYPEIANCFEQAYILYTQMNQKEDAIEALKAVADAHFLQGEYECAKGELLDVLERYRAIGYQNLHYTYDLLAAVAKAQGKYNEALSYALKGMKSIEETGDTSNIDNFRVRLANIYEAIGHDEESAALYKQAFLHIIQKKSTANYSICNKLVSRFISLGKVQEALDFMEKTAKDFPPLGTTNQKFFAIAMGNCYAELQQNIKAEKYYLEALAWEKKEKPIEGKTPDYNFNIGKFYVSQHRYETARPFLEKILNAPVNPFPRLIETHLLLFEIDSAEGNYISAIRHFQQHKMLNDSLFNITKSQQIEELQIIYETDQKEKNIQLLQNESQLQQSQLIQANLTKNITSGGITLLLIIVGLLYSRYRLKQISNRKLEIQQIEINQTNRSLQNLLEEKEWLLREIHHRVKNNLQIVMSLLNTQSAYLESDAALSAIRDSQHRIRSISLIHQKLYQAKNVALIDMPNYIQELIEYLQDSFDTGYRVYFEVDIEPIELDVTQAVPLGLILNEAICNAIKYAFPNHKGIIKIIMSQVNEDHYFIMISDNGVGLPSDFDINKCNSLGMSLMKGLSKQLNGNFELHNNNGLTIHITFANEQISKAFIKSSEMQLTA